jgi:hypothetical protein
MPEVEIGEPGEAILPAAAAGAPNAPGDFGDEDEVRTQ